MLNTIIKFGANVTGKTLPMKNKNHYLLSLWKDKFECMVENIIMLLKSVTVEMDPENNVGMVLSWR